MFPPLFDAEGADKQLHEQFMAAVKAGDEEAAQRQSVQGRASGYPFDNMPPAYGFGPLGSILNIIIAESKDDIIPWSYWPMLRDRQLRKLWKIETIMSGGLYSIAARVKALPWDIVTDKIRVKAHYQDLLSNSDLANPFGSGWTSLIQKTVLDLLTQDNGAFWELIGAGRPDLPLNGPIVGIAHLDSGMCWRTHDPDMPVIYINPYTGSYHGLHRSRVVCMAAMEQPDELARGVGFCGVSRALRWLRIADGIARYRDEKINGRFTRGILYGSGFTRKQYTDEVSRQQEIDDSSGLTAFSGMPMIFSQQPGAELKMLELARLPDGFNLKEEIDLYVYCLALAFGTDAREFWPATASGATKADASVQHIKAQGKGIADLIQTVEREINWRILPPGVEFAFDFTDDERDLLDSQVRQAKATTLQLLVTMGAMSPDQAQTAAIRQGIIEPDDLRTGQRPVNATDEAPLDTANVADEQENEAQMPPEISVKSKGLAALASIAARKSSVHDQLVAFDRRLVADSRMNKVHFWQVVKPGAKAADAGDGGGAPENPSAMKLTDGYKKRLGKTLAAFPDYSGDADAYDHLKADYTNDLQYGVSEAYTAGAQSSGVDDATKKLLIALALASLGYFVDSFLPDFQNAVAAAGAAMAADAFLSRLEMYAGAYWQSLWLGASQRDGYTGRVRRVLDPGAKHCMTCPPKAGVYDSYDDMVNEVGLPGDGDDDCVGNCRCTVEFENADAEFEAPDFSLGTSVTPLFSLLPTGEAA